MRRIAIINQKGGVGKTTTAVNVGAGLARRGRRVLWIDLDPQAHLTFHLGIDPRSCSANLHTLLTRHQTLKEVRQSLGERTAVVPSHIDLATAEGELVSVIGRETILRNAILNETEYDYVILDCPPSLGILTLNGLSAANEVVIPMQPHFLALQGVSTLLDTIRLVHDRINPELRVTGVLLCMHEPNTRLACEVIDDLRAFFVPGRHAETPWAQARIFETIIRRNIKLAECPSHGMSIFDYAPGSHGAVDYQKLADEIDETGFASANDTKSARQELETRAPTAESASLMDSHPHEIVCP